MKSKILTIIALAACTIFGCTKDGKDGSKSLIDVVAEAKGINCSSGGFMVMTGIDLNDNNILDANEVQNTQYICNGSDGGSDKQIRIYFPANGYGYGTTSSVGQVESIENIYNFDITSYLNADSIVFGSYLLTYDVNVNCTVELYNTTNDTVIDNTALSSNSLTWEWKSTIINFIDNIPKSPITLGIRAKSQVEGTNVFYYLPMLIIYRK